MFCNHIALCTDKRIVIISSAFLNVDASGQSTLDQYLTRTKPSGFISSFSRVKESAMEYAGIIYNNWDSWYE